MDEKLETPTLNVVTKVDYYKDRYRDLKQLYIDRAVNYNSLNLDERRNLLEYLKALLDCTEYLLDFVRTERLQTDPKEVKAGQILYKYFVEYDRLNSDVSILLPKLIEFEDLVFPYIATDKHKEAPL
jgi:hypothetical protein